MGEDSKNSIPHLPLKVNEKDINKGALQILKVIRPKWKVESVQFKLLTDGITNKLVGCRPKDEDVAETVLVRVYGNKTDLLIDRKAETSNIILLGSLNLAPSLFATFENGLAYQFVPGCTLTEATLKQPQVYRLVAKLMAKLHKVQITDQENHKPIMWNKIEKFLQLVPEVFSEKAKHQRYLKIGTPKAKLHAELSAIKPILANLKSPVVFCHNDLLLGNVIYTEEKSSVTFIDYEYAAFNYQAFDIANHFLEFAGVDNVDYTKYPSREYQMDWYKAYLEEFVGDYNDQDIQRLATHVDKFTLASHLLWAIWALIQAEHSYIDFDFMGYSAIRLNEYFRKKQELGLLEVIPR